MTIDEAKKDAQDRMEKAVDQLQKRMVGLRTGRATPGLVENVRVEYYGTATPLKQMANITAPEPQVLVIKPFDAGALKDIDKAIRASDLGLSPNNDGKVIRLNVPSLSGDQRKKLVAKAKEYAEEQRVAVRNIRRDANKSIDTIEKGGTVSEDACKLAHDDIQTMLKKFEDQINDLLEKKNKEIME